jgi:hypothetical protein
LLHTTASATTGTLHERHLLVRQLRERVSDDVQHAAADCNDGNVCTTDTCTASNVSALNFNGADAHVTMGSAAGETALGARAFTARDLDPARRRGLGHLDEHRHREVSPRSRS